MEGGGKQREAHAAQFLIQGYRKESESGERCPSVMRPSSNGALNRLHPQKRYTMVKITHSGVQKRITSVDVGQGAIVGCTALAFHRSRCQTWIRLSKRIEVTGGD